MRGKGCSYQALPVPLVLQTLRELLVALPWKVCNFGNANGLLQTILNSADPNNGSFSTEALCHLNYPF